MGSLSTGRRGGRENLTKRGRKGKRGESEEEQRGRGGEVRKTSREGRKTQEARKRNRRVVDSAEVFPVSPEETNRKQSCLTAPAKRSCVV